MGEVLTSLPRHPHNGNAASSVSSIMLVALGLGAYLGWQIVDISPTLFPSPRPGVGGMVLGSGYAATAGLIGLLLFMSLTGLRDGPLLTRRWPIALSTMGTFLGTGLVYAFGWMSPETVPAGVIVGRLLFCSSAAFVVLWGEAVCKVGIGRTLECIATAYLVAFCCCLVVAYMNPPAVYLFRMSLPLLSGAALWCLHCDILSGQVFPNPSGGGQPHDDRAEDDAMQERPGESAGTGWRMIGDPRPSRLPFRLFLGIGIFGAVFTAANHLSETKAGVSTELYTLLAGAAVSVVILAVAFINRKRQMRFVLLYRLVSPLVIGCLLLTIVLEPGRQHYEALAIGAAWTFFRVFAWTLWAHIGSTSSSGAAPVFGFGQAVLTTFDIGAELLFSHVGLAKAPLPATAAVIILIAVLTPVFVMDEKSMARLSASDADVREATPGSGRLNKALDNGPSDGDESISEADVFKATEEFGLSDRERFITTQVVRGLSDEEICSLACITRSTLRTHLRNVYAKLDVHSRSEMEETVQRRVRGDIAL